MELNREKLKRMFEDTNGNGGSANGGGGGGSLAGYATQAWVNEGFVSIDFFNRLFTVYGPGETSSDPDVVIEPNDLDSTIKNIKAMFGLWTEQYLSALGLNPGGTGFATSLSMLDDVDITTPTNGQALVYNSTSLKWENQTISTVTALANLTDVLLTSPVNGQTLLYDSANAKWYNSALKTINGQSLLGSGDISVGGGASGNYLPLSGGTLTGLLTCANGDVVIDAYKDRTPYRGLYFRGGEFYTTSRYNMSIFSYDHSSNNVTPDGLSINAYDGISFCTGSNSRNERMRITSDGKLGFGTASPAYPVDILGNVRINSYDDRYLRLMGNTASFYLISFRNDDIYMGYYYNINSFIFNKNVYLQEKLGIGVQQPSYVLDISGSARITSASNRYLWFNGSTTFMLIGFIDNTHYFGYYPADNVFYISNKLICESNLDVRGNIYASGAITALSDIKQKNIKEYMQLGIDEVANAPIIKFTWKDPKAEDKGLQVGSIAQYWEKVLPEAVKKDKEGTLSMSYGVVALVAAISTAKKVRELDERVTKLEKIER